MLIKSAKCSYKISRSLRHIRSTFGFFVNQLITYSDVLRHCNMIRFKFHKANNNKEHSLGDILEDILGVTAQKIKSLLKKASVHLATHMRMIQIIRKYHDECTECVGQKSVKHINHPLLYKFTSFRIILINYLTFIPPNAGVILQANLGSFYQMKEISSPTRDSCIQRLLVMLT